MGGAQHNRPEIDESLLLRVATLPPGGQRWLKTALEAIATIEPLAEEEKEERSVLPKKEAQPQGSASLDEVLSGEAGLREQTEAYPELSEELQGIAEIADLLREAGRQRRNLGEQILREEILGEPESESDEEEGEEEEEEEEDG